MWIYIINLLLIIVAYLLLFKVIKCKYCKEIFCAIVFLLFTLIQGLRAIDVGNDTANYVKYYGLIKNMKIYNIIICKDWVIEPGYGLLMKLCFLLCFSPQLYLITVATIINGGLMYAIYKYSENPLLSVIIFVGVEFCNLSFTALRQMIAVIIILNSYKFIKENKLVRFVLMVLFAASFHKSALIFLPMYFIGKIKINKKILLIGAGIFALVQLTALPLIRIIVEKIYYTSYLKNLGGGITQAIVILVYLVFGIIVKRYCMKEKENERECDLLITIIYFAFLIQSLAYQVNMINRLMWYFYIFIIIFLPFFCKQIDIEYKIKRHSIKLRYVSYITIAVLSLAQYIFFSMDMYNVIPYSFLI